MPLKLNSSGGGSVTFDVPSTGSTFTLTAPAKTATILTSADTIASTGPAFHAYASSNTSIPINTQTKVTFNAELYDTASCFDTTNSRFTPNVAGYYQFSYNMIMAQIISTNFFPALYKNGSEHLRAPQINGVYGGGGSGLIYLNGSTDYVEVYLFQATVNPATVTGGATGARETYITGFLARSA